MLDRALNQLVEMLTWKRPGGSESEAEFVRRWIEPLGAARDEYGNYVLRIGDSPVMWCSHYDTVHDTSGRQRVKVRSGVVSLRQRSVAKKDWKGKPYQGLSGECLGADDTTGVWLMREMVREGVPGLYVWHADEEVGCGGSSYIVRETPELLDGVVYAIALDRRGDSSVITHQLGWRTCSEACARSIAAALGIATLRPDSTGAYTDSEQYAEIVSECTNISVGYDGQHSALEVQDLRFAAQLRAALLRFEWKELVCERRPEDEPPWWKKGDTHSLSGEFCGTAGDACELCQHSLEDEKVFVALRYEVCWGCYKKLTGDEYEDCDVPPKGRTYGYDDLCEDCGCEVEAGRIWCEECMLEAEK